MDARALLASVAIFAGAALANAQATLADVHGLSPQQIRMEAFTLTAPQDVRIEAVGEEGDRDDRFTVMGIGWQGGKGEPQPWIGNAWILDLGTRRTVWELSSARTTSGQGGTRQFNGTVRLPAGTYAAYLSAYPPAAYTDDDSSFVNRAWKWIGGEHTGDYRLVVRGNGRPLSAADIERQRRDRTAGALVAFRGTGPELFEQAGFILDKPAEIEMYAVGEAREDAEFDSGWIVNADTREKVWKLTWRESTPAGGASKNRAARLTKRLPAGRYAAFYATDDSHDLSAWNSPPPHDPDAWGLTLRVAGGSAATAARTFDYEHVPASSAFIALTGVGNGEARQAGFTLKRAMDVRVYAMGEGREHRMFDYAWITGGASRARVWEMRYAETEHAGGDAKNRLVDRTLRLEPGNYVVHYVTDNSHAFGEWNAAAPAGGKYWGITLLSASGTLDRSTIARYDPKSDPGVVAALTGIRDADRAQKRFTLDRETTLRVYALGEGTGRELADYGWIEEAKTGRTVWEMTYAATSHAGGAPKNRRLDATITLPAGNYLLRYETDDSHAFGGWNADPPDDPEMWGITLYRAR